jgi:hypothetical protein
MRSFPRAFCCALLASAFAASAPAQTPKALLRFDGNLADSSGAGVVTSVTANNFTPSYTADRKGIAGSAITFTQASSLRIVTAVSNNSNQALGLRNAAGTNTSFTLVAWVRVNSTSSQGYNTIFGNLGSGAGTLHAGLGSNTAKTHFGFDGNDANGATTDIVANQWYHLAFVYDASTQTQFIYINGVPEIIRTGVTNTLKAADLLIGNWGTVSDSNNDLRGALDDVAVYSAALDAGQVQALFNDVNPTALPAPGTYSAPKLPGYYVSSPANWYIREIKAYTSAQFGTIGTGTLVNADRIIRAYSVAPGGTVANYQHPTINHIDDSGAGTAGYFTSNQRLWGTNVVGADDNNFLMLAKCAVRITEEDDYTFGFRGDDGARLRVIGQQFISSTRLNTSNAIDPAHHGDGIYHINGSGDSNTLGVVHLKPGDYNLELVWWEGSGGSSVEVFAAKGALNANDGSFRLVGDTANGGLQIVRDPDTLPQVLTFTANGTSPSFYVHNGVPASVTLSWTTNSADVPGQTVTINQGIGAQSQNGSITIATPAATTTYTLSSQIGIDITTRNVTVRVNAAPVISSFTAERTKFISGQPLRLNWNAEGAATLTLQPGNINVTGQSGITVNPAADTTYTLTATNPSGTVQQSVSVQIGPGPVINTFAVADANPLFAAETSLAWNVSNADTISIDQGVGSVPAIGIAPVLVYQTTAYTLSATNTFGTVTATTTVNQPTPIGVSTAGFTVRRVNSNTPFPFAGQGYLQSAVSLVGQTSGGPQYNGETSGNFTRINFSDGADGDFTSGNVGFPGGGGDNFAARITGTLIVNTPGEYTFVVNCDDGCRLRIDGQDVIVDDGTHGPSASSGRITLSNPTAQIELIYYDATGGASLELGWIRPNLQWQLLANITPAAPIVRGQVLISEFVADNKETGVLDEDGLASDWIEIWNSTNASVNLSGYFLTDDQAVPNKWAFPSWTLGADKYLLAFASGNDRKPAQAVPGQDNPGTLAQPRLHTNFKLNKTGGYLALTKANGSGGFDVVTVFTSYPPQEEDVSYGSSDSEGFTGFMETTTPGQPNAVTVQGFVRDTRFVDAANPLIARKRGRYTTPFNLAIVTDTPDVLIRFTTDGSTPTRTKGTLYTGPIPIAGTKAIRALAYKPGWKATEVDTQTYLFIDDVVTQSNATATALGWPTAPINGQVFRWGMNLSAVTAGGGTLQTLKSALAAAPSVCMTTDVENFTDPATGIYVNPGRRGRFWERPASVEYINAAGTSEFQIDCGVRIRGGASRAVSNPRHAFHLYFRGSIYDGDLKYPLFGTKGASRFDQIDMRTEQNYSWAKDTSSQNTLLREQWGRVTQADMGQPNSRTGYFHLYVNGIYWGIFNWEERTEAAFGATYLGGEKDNYDTVKSAGNASGYNTEMTDGNFAAWQTLFTESIALKNDASETSRTARYMKLRGLNPDGTRNAAYPVLLDVNNLIDYLLVIFYDGSYDAPLSTFLSNASNNWFGIRDRMGQRGFTYYVHDNEHGMDSPARVGDSYNRIGPWGGSGANNWNQTQYNSRETFTKSNPQYLHELLAYSAEYRQRFADRVQRHCFNGGALQHDKALARLNALANQVSPIIDAEAARWGSTSLNRNSWNSARQTVASFMSSGGILPSSQTTWPSQTRTSLLVTQLRGYTDAGAKPLFSPTTLGAPTLSGPFGGPVSAPHNLTISHTNAGAVIYYTLNGQDPRAPGGGISPTAQTAASPINIALTQTTTVKARAYIATSLQWSPLVEADFLAGALASPANLAISKIHYNPAGSTDLEEFIEVMNIGAQTIDLTNVRFTLGVQFEFPQRFAIEPGGRALIVRDLAAFNAANSGIPASQIAGTFQNDTNLDNAGERLQVVSSDDSIIRDFSYDDESPWPVTSDGGGPCIVLVRPETNPDHNIGTNWRTSAAVGGAPGGSDSMAYTAWATANTVGDVTGTGDLDFDGIASMLEYAMGMHPGQPSLLQPITAVQTILVDGVPGQYFTISFKRVIGRDDVALTGEAAGSLGGAWTPAIPVGSPVFNGDGTETLTYRHPQTYSSGTEQFLRIKATRLP